MSRGVSSSTGLVQAHQIQALRRSSYSLGQYGRPLMMPMLEQLSSATMMFGGSIAWIFQESYKYFHGS
jgi:hypothetical protein